MNQISQNDQSTEHLNPNVVNAFIDDELLPEEQQGAQHHLSTCHSCTLRVLSATRLKAATGRAGQRFAPPPEALARLTAHLHLQPTQTEPRGKKVVSIDSFRAAAWTALAAAILLTISFFGWRQLHQRDTLAAELLDQHLSTLSAGATPEVISTDRHTVKPWFQGRLPFSFNLPETLPPDTILKGADLTYFNGQPAALLLYTIHKHEVSIFVTQRYTSPTHGPLPNTRAGFYLRTATTSDLNLFAVSDVNPTDLDLLVAALVSVQKPA
ncbi:zf-HC2 domain-containing protein [Tunturiibacter empetritectus]|uniref:Anti-sigma factor RsiW n=2 Tax=Tunturiibacter TaxID=3154218 RepID=A0A852VFD9_9BACT|nr:zf-HC2 domain-containing protein [Edaphobacter lichenicola]NYF90360.1 anti-sigma factor RsiW [Edaphobacter lichenicola]